MDKASPAVRAALKRSRERQELTAEEGLLLYTAEGDDLRAAIKCADLARAEDVGDEVTYVVNRNINFTNICFVGCQFCGFKRQRWESDAYDHSDETILDKVGDAVARGATEICMQGGINPDMPPLQVSRPARHDKGGYPEIHIHAFSPMEIMYGARRVRMDYPEYIAMLREAGLGSIPGTAAEILDDSVREILSHKKVDVAAWVDIITTAHALGVRTTSTVMYGHVESPRHVVNHLNLLRDIQKQTHGFTEFVPLRFIHENTVLFRKGLVVRAAAQGHARLPDVRDFAPVPARANRQPADLVGQARRRTRRAHAEGRMQRFFGHADGGKHHGPGRRRFGRVRPGRRNRRKGARDGPGCGRTQHALQEALREEGSQWRAADHHVSLTSPSGRSPRLRGEWGRLSSFAAWCA